MPLNQAPRPRRFKLAFRRRFPTYRLPLEPTAPVISILQTSPEHSPTDCQGRIRFEPGLNADGKTALIMGTGVAAINTNADAREQQTPPGLMKSSASSHSIGSSVDQLLTPNASCDPFDSDAEIDNALSDEDEDETSTPSPSPTRNRGIGKGKTAFYLAAGTDASLPSSPPSLPPPPTLVPLTGDDMDVPIATFELFPMPPYEWTGGQVWPKYEGEDGSVVTLNVRKWSAARRAEIQPEPREIAQVFASVPTTRERVFEGARVVALAWIVYMMWSGVLVAYDFFQKGFNIDPWWWLRVSTAFVTCVLVATGFIS